MLAPLGAIAAALLGAAAGTLVARPLAALAWRLVDGAGAPPRRRWLPWVCAAVGASLALRLGPTPELAELAALAAALVVITLTDLDAFLIPDPCVIAAALVRLAFVALSSAADPPRAAALLVDSVLRAAVIALVLLALVAVMDHVLGHPSMGGGDIKLIAVASLYFGWWECVFLLLVASVVGVAFGLSHASRTPGGPPRVFPFAPAIALGCWLTVLVGAAPGLPFPLSL